MRDFAHRLYLYLFLTAAGAACAGAQTTSMASSANPSVYGNAVTFTAVVQPVSTTTYVPTGTVTFYDGANPIGSGSLDSQGTAQLTTGSLGVGQHSITAQYAGDAHFAVGTSAPYSQQVVSRETFTLASSPSSMTTAAGQAAQYDLTTTGNYAFTDQVSFTCQGLPAEAECTFAPPNVTGDTTNPVHSAFTISTQASAVPQPSGPGSGRKKCWDESSGQWFWCSGLVVAGFGARRRKVLGFLCLALLSVAFIGCGGRTKTDWLGAGTPPGTYFVTVVGTSPHAVNSTSVLLTVK